MARPKPKARRRTKPLELAIELEAEVLFEAVEGQQIPAKRIDSRRLKLPRGVRYWFTARTVAGDYDVVLSNERVLKDLKGRVGVTLANDGLIALDEESPLLRIVIVLFHELMGHGILSAPGDDDLNAHLFGCRPAKSIVVEERIVTHMAPRWADCLIRSGLLRLPPIPRLKKARKA